MKNKLIVMYEQDPKNPKNSWSGTAYQLHEALKAYYDVIFIDSSDSKYLKVLKILAKRIEKEKVSTFLKPLYEKLHKKEINRKIKKYRDIPVLEIAENVNVDNDFYLYRDMAYACYPYVLDKFKDDKNDYGHGMLKHISKDVLNKRILDEEYLESKAKKTFVMGKWIERILKEKYPNISDKFLAVGGGLNNEFININVNNKNYSKKILFVGIDYLRKGGDLLVEAFKILKEKYDNDAELIIAGQEVNINYEGIRCVGKKSREELSKLFEDANVFCMPSRFEAYGLVFIEALCYGLPVVSIDDYEMHYFVENEKNGYLIKKYDANELAKALHKAINNKEMMNYVRDNTNVIKDNYSWDKVAKIIKEEIDRDSYGK